MNLNLDFCSYKAAKYSVMKWHYSKKMPCGKLMKIGVWEDGCFIGCVIFGRGANNVMHKFFKVEKDELCELVRVALNEHKNPVTKIISIALKILKKENPGLKLVFSYADETNQGHKGIIYKAGNWEYVGERKHDGYIKLNGKVYHCRSMNAKYGGIKNYPKGWEYAKGFIKHLFRYDLRQ